MDNPDQKPEDRITERRRNEQAHRLELHNQLSIIHARLQNAAGMAEKAGDSGLCKRLYLNSEEINEELNDNLNRLKAAKLLINTLDT